MSDRLTVQQAAEMLQVSIPQVRYWIKQGILPGVYLRRPGCRVGQYLIYRDQVNRFKGVQDGTR